eukprot:scaffold77488_cov60-Phaeocystis_antarctica.AAC.3
MKRGGEHVRRVKARKRKDSKRPRIRVKLGPRAPRAAGAGAGRAEVAAGAAGCARQPGGSQSLYSLTSQGT